MKSATYRWVRKKIINRYRLSICFLVLFLQLFYKFEIFINKKNFLMWIQKKYILKVWITKEQK